MVDKGEYSHDGPDHVKDHACKKWDYSKARGATLTAFLLFKV